MNECHFGGNLTREPELRPAGSSQVCKFGIAVNRPIKGEGEALFLTCEAWAKGGETIAKYFKKGDPIIVIGELRQDSWDDKDGNKRTAMVLRVNRFHFVPSRRREEEALVGAVGNHETASEEGAIPF